MNWKNEEDITQKYVAIASEDLPSVTIQGSNVRTIEVNQETSIGVIAQLTECIAGNVKI